MASSAMPPPPSPLAHRRTRPFSASSSLDTSSCGRRKMSLSKSATFHQPSSPSTEDDPVISVAHLSKRSTTYTRSSFASWLYNGREAAADVIADFEQTFSGARGSRPAARRRSAREFEDQLLAKAQLRASSPVDSGVGSSIGSPSEKNLSRTLEKALDLTSNKDSALGESVAGSVEGGSETLIQEANTRQSRPSRTTRSSGPAPLTIIRYPIPSAKKNTQPLLSSFARRQIYKRLFAPLLQEVRFQEFQSIVAGTRKNKNLRCLRDIEQSLINQPVTLAVTPALYRSFGELTIQLVIDTYQHLSESEQRRPTDRAYDNGYFLDLVQQVQQLAAHIGSSDTSVEDGSAPSVEDEITLEGGLGETGNLAELVRWKNGEGISLRTGLPYIAMPGTKRSASHLACEDAMPSARRKKGVEYPVLHLPCTESGCNKVFSRSCDLSKHEKTHSRPFKCLEPNCKFYTYGLPTEKELDRHMNDKHNNAPVMYHCKFCHFQTKRESNCKQHMEKKHGYEYQRSKGTNKVTNLTPQQTPQTPAMGYQSVEPSPVNQSMAWDGRSSISSSMHESPFEQPIGDFEDSGAYPYTLFPRRTTSIQATAHNTYDDSFDFNTAPLNGNFNLNTNLGANPFDAGGYPTPSSAIINKFTPKTPAYSAITPSPMMGTEHNVANYQYGGADFPTPESFDGQAQQPFYAQDVQPQQYDLVTEPFAPIDLNDFMQDGIMDNDFQLIGSVAGAFTREGAENATLFPAMSTGIANNEYSSDMFAEMDHMDFNNTEDMFDGF